MRSLRTRLFVATVGATSLVFLVAGVVLYLLIRASLLSEFDDSLLAKASALASLTEREGDGIEFELETGRMPEFERLNRPEYFQMWSPDRTTLVKSPSLEEDSLDSREFAGNAEYRFIKLRNGLPGRQLALATSVHRDREDEIDGDSNGEGRQRAEESAVSPILLCVARDTVELNEKLSQMAWMLASVAALASLCSAGVLLVVVSFGLRPVNMLAARIAKLDSANLSNGIELPQSMHELQPVVDRLNELLERLEKAITRERAFTADVAHELRTPIAGLVTALEVCASKPRDAAAYQEVVAKCLTTSHTMRAMVNNLLTLARADAGQLALDVEPIELTGFAMDCWRPFEGRAAKRGLTVDWPASTEKLEITTDREKLRLVLQNVFDNAVRYADESGRVVIDVRGNGDTAKLGVENSGCTIPPDEVGNVFDRFWKFDDVRKDGADHCGLGLPLCRKIVEILGGTIRATVNEHGIFKVRLVLRGIGR